MKEQSKENVKEVKKFLMEYLNNYDEFRNKVNQMINDELIRLDQNNDIAKPPVKWEPMDNSNIAAAKKYDE